MTPAVLYAVFDGLFQQCLLKHLAGDADAIAQMQADVRAVLARFARKPAAPVEVVKIRAVKAGATAAKQKTSRPSKRATAGSRARA